MAAAAAGGGSTLFLIPPHTHPANTTNLAPFPPPSHLVRVPTTTAELDRQLSASKLAADGSAKIQEIDDDEAGGGLRTSTGPTLTLLLLLRGVIENKHWADV